VQRTPSKARVPQLIRQLHFAPKRVTLTASHPTLNCATTTTFRCNGYVPGVWNKLVANTTTYHKHLNLVLHLLLAFV
jgi:hypothetical protein